MQNNELTSHTCKQRPSAHTVGDLIILLRIFLSSSEIYLKSFIITDDSLVFNDIQAIIYSCYLYLHML